MALALYRHARNLIINRSILWRSLHTLKKDIFFAPLFSCESLIPTSESNKCNLLLPHVHSYATNAQKIEENIPEADTVASKRKKTTTTKREKVKEEEAKDKVKASNHANHSSLVKRSYWKTVFEEPYNWYDYRTIKRNQEVPDFRHKGTGEALWVDSENTPAWVATELEKRGIGIFASFPTMQSLWKIYFADPSNWLDNHNAKESEAAPDYVHKDTGEPLWIDSRTTPSWVQGKLNELGNQQLTTSASRKTALTKSQFKWHDEWYGDHANQASKLESTKSNEVSVIKEKFTSTMDTTSLSNTSKSAFTTFQSKGSRWETYFADPSKWFDNRKNKKNPKAPDFVHKVTKETLWISGRNNPPWVVTKLKKTENEAFASHESNQIDHEAKEQNLKTPNQVSNVNEKAPFTNSQRSNVNVKAPSTNSQGTNVNEKAPSTNKKWTPAASTFNSSYKDNLTSTTALDKEYHWKNYFADPSKWFDNRKNKKNPKAPDFKHRVTGVVLWIVNNKNPDWVVTKFKDAQNEVFTSADANVSEAKKLANGASVSYDNGMKKDTGRASIVKTATPKLSKPRDKEAVSSTNWELKWKSYFDNPSKWFDNRIKKTNSKAPDFKHKDTREALWVKSKSTPAWVINKLGKLNP